MSGAQCPIDRETHTQSYGVMMCAHCWYVSIATMRLGQFHRTFLDEFAPVVIGYVNDLDASLKVDLSKSFDCEIWTPVR